MPKFAANISFLFPDVPFEARFAAAARAGFRAVEFHYPYEYEPGALRALLCEPGLDLVLFNTPRGNVTAGEMGLACQPDGRSRFEESIDAAIAYATALHCPAIHVLTGIVPAGADERSVYRTCVDNLAAASERIGRAGCKATLEALNPVDVPGYFLDRPSKVLDVIRDTGAANLFMQYDVYHAYLTEGDVPAAIDHYRASIAHVQIADVPGRHEPGTGTIDYGEIFKRLDRRGYSGWIGCEYRPLGDTNAGLAWAKPWLQGTGDDSRNLPVPGARSDSQ